METTFTPNEESPVVAEPDSDVECIEDCCVCRCCDEQEECSLEE